MGQDLDKFFADQAKDLIDFTEQEHTEELLHGREYLKGTDFILSGHSAGAYHGFCSDSAYGVEVMNPVKGSVEGQNQGNFMFTEQLYFDEAEVVTMPSGRQVTGKLQTILDMIHSGNDVARTDEAIVCILQEFPELEVLTYLREHGLTNDEITFAWEGLTDGMVKGNSAPLSEMSDVFKDFIKEGIAEP